MLSCFSHVWLFVTLWIVACQAPLSTGFFRQEYWSGLPCPPPEDLWDPGIKLVSFMFPALSCRFFTTEPPGKPSFPEHIRNKAPTPCCPFYWEMKHYILRFYSRHNREYDKHNPSSPEVYLFSKTTTTATLVFLNNGWWVQLHIGKSSNEFF